MAEESERNKKQQQPQAGRNVCIILTLRIKRFRGTRLKMTTLLVCMLVWALNERFGLYAKRLFARVIYNFFCWLNRNAFSIIMDSNWASFSTEFDIDLDGVSITFRLDWLEWVILLEIFEHIETAQEKRWNLLVHSIERH